MNRSAIPPSVLLLDDGELDSVDSTLRRIGADYLRVTGAGIDGKLQQPRDLLITSGSYTLEMPELESAEGRPDPTWVSVNSQDFLPLRQRMRERGVDFVVHGSLDLESLRLFLLQMLYRGSERRSGTRLPLATDVGLLVNRVEKSVRLLEVSAESCRILSPEPVSMDSSVTLILPSAISGGDRCELRGMAVRSSLCQTRSGDVAYSVVLRYDDLEAETRAVVDKLLRGEQISQPVSPLSGADRAATSEGADPVASTEAGAPDEPSDGEARERRGSIRSVYERRVDLLEACDSGSDASGLGCDLSLEGVRVRGYSGLESGAWVTLALYGGRREEPVVIRATVARSAESGVVTFRFEEPGLEQKRGLERLVTGLGRLESLERDGPVVVTKLVGDS
jgi:hypothetical protein